jgi:hypothetical protein
MSKLFVPSSSLLLSMIKAAETKFEGDREQAILRKEAHEEARAVRAEVNRAKAIAQRQKWGSIDARGRVVY